MMLAKRAAAVAATALNFAVVGGHRSGAAVVQSGLSRVPTVACHGDLLFSERGTLDEQDAIRREAHEAYYGPSRDPRRLPEWCHREANPYRYLIDQVFDNPRYGESRIGVRLLYPAVARHELYDLLAERFHEGDFCVIHVVRNPIACLVSAKQAALSGVWLESAAGEEQACAPMSVNLCPEETAAYVRKHEAVARKLRQACTDAVEVKYRDLVFRYDATMADIMEFLELPQQRVPMPATRRLVNREMRSRIGNFDALRAASSCEVRRWLDEDLF